MRILVDERTLPGRHLVFWDERDRTGLPLAGGVYFAVLRTKAAMSSRKVLLLR